MFCPKRYILYNAELLGKKTKTKKSGFFPRQKGQTLKYGCGMNFQSKLFLR